MFQLQHVAGMFWENERMFDNLKYVDLFAGCGGLSLGLEKAGFELALAVEKSPMAAETFYHNFIERITDRTAYERFASEETSVEEQAAKGLVIKELEAVLESPAVLKKLRDQQIDLVAGGPPCQGFSLAGRRNPDDVRNQLPWQFIEFVEAVNPKAVLVENVSGMAQDFRKQGKASPFDDLRIALGECGEGYEVQPALLNAMHFGAPQHRPRVMLLALRTDIAATVGFEGSEHTWRSEYDSIENLLFPERPLVAPLATHFDSEIFTVADAIGDLSPKGYRRLSNLPDFAHEMRTDSSWMPVHIAEAAGRSGLTNHTLRKHTDATATRFRIYQFFRDQQIHPKTIGIPKQAEVSDAGKRKQLRAALAGASFPAKGGDGAIIASSINDLVELIMELGTKKHSQRPLAWNKPSPTVVSLPDDYVHPSEPRTLTVREMARFQSFPDSFEFRSKETTGSHRRRFEVPQYTQVGNAVPPKMAEAAGKAMREALQGAAQASSDSNGLKRAG
ncbi:DNA cytosine methyltransferase [Parvularcula sp. ZS-1/3]|uniref:Cytosine-specific methyltransferase n=1 Tax=Parvularcula mediterranea TaxID=2732508 RepID=A0A7Y3W4D3_9PROT|nr:DNA cytosine methyltransferase [Parvularcula mediterranea]NNU15111.1 DNA cytosine methyltransferase [Parvularcula mediterranea]